MQILSPLGRRRRGGRGQFSTGKVAEAAVEPGGRAGRYRRKSMASLTSPPVIGSSKAAPLTTLAGPAAGGPHFSANSCGRSAGRARPRHRAGPRAQCHPRSPRRHAGRPNEKRPAGDKASTGRKVGMLERVSEEQHTRGTSLRFSLCSVATLLIASRLASMGRRQKPGFPARRPVLGPLLPQPS
jgi:hypothetical protein